MDLEHQLFNSLSQTDGRTDGQTHRRTDGQGLGLRVCAVT